MGLPTIPTPLAALMTTPPADIRSVLVVPSLASRTAPLVVVSVIESAVLLVDCTKPSVILPSAEMAALLAPELMTVPSTIVTTPPLFNGKATVSAVIVIGFPAAEAPLLTVTTSKIISSSAVSVIAPLVAETFLLTVKIPASEPSASTSISTMPPLALFATPITPSTVLIWTLPRLLM
ncbi:hypothetical protein Rcae01_06486 [Novipirellula caenicola]|uniref:Uncharacterized protein n=1 Tax=Novipirellula caenicola TaxID=1536901 RepID=A0ABP9W0R4_9BACT